MEKTISDAMAKTLEELTAEALALPSISRAILAEKLVESLEFDLDPEIEGAWVEEVEKRDLEIKNGSVQPIDGEIALQQIRQLLNP